MPSLKFNVLAFDDLRAGGLARPAAEKFAGAWLACFLVMARGNILAAFSFEHALLASVCGAAIGMTPTISVAPSFATPDDPVNHAGVVRRLRRRPDLGEGDRLDSG